MTLLWYLSGCISANALLLSDVYVNLKEGSFANSEIVVDESELVFQGSCNPLTNRGAFFSAELLVGTPPEPFDVVVDTGSDAVIIPSCVCQRIGKCDLHDNCHDGTESSSTFSIGKGVPVIPLGFGSGQLEAVAVTDIVRVGTTSVTMQSGLLLMVDRHLDINQSFEGILGLGQLQGRDPREANLETWEEQLFGRGDTAPTIPGFLRIAGIETLSICFNGGDRSGVLRLNTPFTDRPLPSYGVMHWGLNFLGMSAGDATLPALFCHESEECGAIPDSGTTLMLGPTEHVRALFRNICDLWPRCVEAAKRDPRHEKEDHFQMLLFHCENWMGENGVEELPDIYLHFSGPNGKTTLAIAGWSYVIKTLAEQAGKQVELLEGLVSEHLQELQKTLALKRPNQYVCAPAFGSTGTQSGTSPLWILGTPLFYEYVVSFNLASSPPTVGFSTDLCGSCDTENSMMSGINTMIVPETNHQYLSRRYGDRSIQKVIGPFRANNHPKQYVHSKS